MSDSDNANTHLPPKKLSKFSFTQDKKIDSIYLEDRWLQTKELGG